MLNTIKFDFIVNLDNFNPRMDRIVSGNVDDKKMNTTYPTSCLSNEGIHVL